MQEFEQHASPVGEVRSAYTELSRLDDYTNEAVFPTERLVKELLYWREERENPLRSERNLEEVRRLVGFLEFEIAARGGDLSSLESHNKIPAVGTV